MMKINSKMKNFLRSERSSDELSPSLNAVADRGFKLVGGCYILYALSSTNNNASIADFGDETGYECFVNSLHVEDYSNGILLPQALKFVERIFVVWSEANPGRTLVAIISADDGSVVVRFHLAREGQVWLGEDLERYEDAILAVSSAEWKQTTLRDVQHG